MTDDEKPDEPTPLESRTIEQHLRHLPTGEWDETPPDPPADMERWSPADHLRDIRAQRRNR